MENTGGNHNKKKRPSCIWHATKRDNLIDMNKNTLIDLWIRKGILECFFDDLHDLICVSFYFQVRIRLFFAFCGSWQLGKAGKKWNNFMESYIMTKYFFCEISWLTRIMIRRRNDWRKFKKDFHVRFTTFRSKNYNLGTFPGCYGPSIVMMNLASKQWQRDARSFIVNAPLRQNLAGNGKF